MQEKETLFFLDRTIEIVRKQRRRNLTLTMHPERPLRVHSNMVTTRSQIYQFLTHKKNWIEKNLIRFAELEKQFRIPEMKPGVEFPFLGEMKYLQICESSLKRLFFKIEDGFLICYLPAQKKFHDFESEYIYSQLTQFYKYEAQDYLTRRVQFWIQQTGLMPRKLGFRAPKTRWGSCSSRRHISLNWKLICQHPPLIDYVIVHELCHLVHMNHSDSFWQLLESFLPSYREYEKVLKNQERLGIFLKEI